MKNRRDDTPEINDYTYHVFEEIEKRALQFYIPEQWRPLYRAFLKERRRRREIAAAFQGLAKAFELFKVDRTDTTRYSDDFGDKNTTSRKEDPQANTTTRPLEE